MLLEQRAEGLLPLSTRSSLWLHLRYCPYCNRYARQTVLIAQLVQTAASSSADVKLSEAAKQRMRQLLAERL
jgi:hypothetical protein